MEHFTPFASTAGGVLIGLSATILLLGIGKIAGISGILAGSFAQDQNTDWRRVFMVAMIGTGALLAFTAPSLFSNETNLGNATILISGLLVGFGTRLGSGCTSGHGVCGLPRFSIRSLVATGTFIGTGIITVFVMRSFGAL